MVETDDREVLSCSSCSHGPTAKEADREGQVERDGRLCDNFNTVYLNPGGFGRSWKDWVHLHMK